MAHEYAVIDPKIIAVENPTLADREAIFGPLLAYNESKIGDPKFVPFAILLRDADSNAVIGGHRLTRGSLA